MGKYLIRYKETAIKDLQKHKKAGNKSIMNKISQLITELEDHPFSGTGKPEQLKYELSGYWSRRINKEHRLIYQVEDNIVTVIIVAAFGHY